MATESPLIHDGGQCTLGFDARNSTFSGTTLSGPSGSGQYLAVRVSTLASRSIVLTTLAIQSAACYGILQNKGSSGQVADVGINGISKAVAGGTITAGARLVCSATAIGTLVAFSSAADTYAMGTALESAAVGEIFTARIYGSGVLA